MFFLLPIGHDQPYYERPWLTITLIAVCTALLGVTMWLEAAVDPELEAALIEIAIVQAEHPEARAAIEIEGLPESIEQQVAPLLDTTPGRRITDADRALEDALVRLVAALNGIPTIAWGFRPGHPRLGSAFASMFLHGGVFHLVGNMLLLWVAGGVLECFWRRWAYALLYFGAGLVGLAAHWASALHSLTPVVGASGAVSGLLGAFLVGYPHTKIRLLYAGWFMRPFMGKTDQKAWVIIPVWAAIELFDAWSGTDGEVAHWAHVGGFAFGAAIALLARRMGWIAEDAGYSRAPAVEPVPTGEPAFAPTRPLSTAPLPGPVAGAPMPSTMPSTTPSSAPRSAAPSHIPDAIELDALPPPSDDDQFS